MAQATTPVPQPAASPLDPAQLDRLFPQYRDCNPEVPIWCVTPDQSGAIHRFFDTCPISPSGRYLAFFKLPFEDRLPKPGDVGHVGLVDLQTGRQRLVAETRGWETQLGCNLNWGVDDRSLLFNDVDPCEWKPYGVRFDPHRGRRTRLGGTIYHVSPDGTHAASANLAAMVRTQLGYGVTLPSEHVPHRLGPVHDDGLTITDTRTGDAKLLLSIHDAICRATPRFEIDGPEHHEIYGFHAKWSPTGDRLIFTLRFFPHEGQPVFNRISGSPPMKFTVMTVSADGRKVFNAVPTSRWTKIGHHINWFPDGRRLSMNLTLDRDLRFVRCREDGADLEPMTEAVLGSGHPSVHPDGRHLLTDAYSTEPMANDDGTTPLRWVDYRAGRETTIARLPTRTPHQLQPGQNALRVDPHPAWSRDWRFVAFNAFAGGTRRVYLADLSKLLGA